jgi:hypothetical protein
MFFIRNMHSLTVEWSRSRVRLSPRSFSGELKWLEYNCATIWADFAGVVRVSAPKEPKRITVTVPLPDDVENDANINIGSSFDEKQ